MTVQTIFKLSAGIIGAMAISMPVQAASFHGFSFTTTTTDASDPTADIFLRSVSHGGKTISNFSVVTGATVMENSHGSLGPSSTDLGDNATSPNYTGANELPTSQEITDFLGNLNLNNIIDTEERKRSVFELEFGNKVNTFYLFERGLNSSLKVEALDSNGTVLDKFKVNQGLWQQAGYAIDTTEIEGPQNVGSYGIKLDSAVKRVRIISDFSDNGPDYKIVAAQVPEPSSMAALALLGGAVLLAKHRKQVAH